MWFVVDKFQCYGAFHNVMSEKKTSWKSDFTDFQLVVYVEKASVHSQPPGQMGDHRGINRANFFSPGKMVA